MRYVFRLPQYWRDFLPIVSLALLVFLIFREHLSGAMTFPWDFQGAYYAYAVSLLRDGTFLNPPVWFPWGGMGFPKYLSLQDGAWYIPLYVYDFFGAYDLVGATRLQVFHVAAASIGSYFLCRKYGVGRFAALIAAIGYAFSGSFYSNSQHVDIVRGAAILPWLLFFLEKVKWDKNPAFGFLGFTLILWQFLIASYPGIIVSSFYVLFFANFLFIFKPEMIGGWKRLLLMGVSCVGAALLSMPKFFPIISGYGGTVEIAAPAGLLGWREAATLFSDFDIDGLKNDVTMRDIYFPSVLIFFAILGFGGWRWRYLLFPLSAIFSFVFFVSEWGVFRDFVVKVPGSQLSRFQVSDFRPMLHLALVILAAKGLNNIFYERELKCGSFILYFSLLFVLLVFFYAYMQGVSISSWEIFGVLLGGAACFQKFKYKFFEKFLAGFFIVLISIVVVFSAMTHQNNAKRVWSSPRTDAHEISVYGGRLSELVDVDRYKAIEYRPERMLFHDFPVNISALFDQRYDSAWVNEYFSAYGYGNLRSHELFRRVYELAQGEDAWIAEWLIRRSSVYLQPSRMSLDVAAFRECEETVCFNGGGAADIKLLAYRENGADYHVKLLEPSIMIENEMGYPGWSSKLCDPAGRFCRKGPDAYASMGVLRTWELPPGDYLLVTSFEVPGWEKSVVMACLGFLLLLSVLVFLFFHGRLAKSK